MRNSFRPSVQIEKGRVRRRKALDSLESVDQPLPFKQEIRRLLLELTDTLSLAMTVRHQRIHEFAERFGDFCRPSRLFAMNREEQKKLASSFANTYAKDVSADDLTRELHDFTAVISKISEPPATAVELVQYLASWDEDVCPNLRVALQILLTVGCTIAGCERSFSKLKLILTYLRSTMTQERLTNLALLSIEKKTTNSCNYEALVDDFVSAKVRKFKL